MRRLMYRLRYALWLYALVPGMPLLVALGYPAPGPEVSDGDPREDAESEASCFLEG